MAKINLIEEWKLWRANNPEEAKKTDAKQAILRKQWEEQEKMGSLEHEK